VTLDLIGPLLADTSAQARAGNGYARADFTVDDDSQTVTCPQGKTSSSWTPCTQRGQATARAAEKSIPFQADYARRAGVEGTMHQAASHGARRARYRGLPKTRLDHAYMAVALNLLRLEAFWTGTPLDRQQTSHLARLELELAA
jgi:hypothetical protein